MDLYTVKVNLNGNTDNQVIKKNVTASEIRLLEWIHGRSENGKPPIAEVELTGRVKRQDQQERARLLSFYGELADENGKLDSGQAIIDRLLGVRGVALPQTYEAPVFEAMEDAPLPEAIEDEVIELVDPTPVVVSAEPIKRTKPRSAVEALAG